jgi:hypothetical protein
MMLHIACMVLACVITNSVHFASAFLLVLYCVYIPDCKQLALDQFTLSDLIAVLLSDVVHKRCQILLC